MWCAPKTSPCLGFSGNPENQSNGTYIRSDNVLPLLLWSANAKRIVAAAGLSPSQSVRCVTNHLAGAAQRLFFEQFTGQLSYLSVNDLGSRLMTMIPGHEQQFTREALSLTFNKNTLFVRMLALLYFAAAILSS